MQEIRPLLERAFAAVGGVAPPGSELDQLGLADGDRIVLELLEHGEPGLALEHLIYMAYEPALPLWRATLDRIEQAGRAMKLDARLWEPLRSQVVDGPDGPARGSSR